MPQLIENKHNGPILIENSEPTACAGNSAQQVETRTRVSSMHKHTQRHRAGDAARKVHIQRRGHCAVEPAACSARQSRYEARAQAKLARVLGLTTLFIISLVLRFNTRIDVWILGGSA